MQAGRTCTTWRRGVPLTRPTSSKPKIRPIKQEERRRSVEDTDGMSGSIQAHKATDRRGQYRRVSGDGAVISRWIEIWRGERGESDRVPRSKIRGGERWKDASF